MGQLPKIMRFQNKVEELLAPPCYKYKSWAVMIQFSVLMYHQMWHAPVFGFAEWCEQKTFGTDSSGWDLQNCKDWWCTHIWSKKHNTNLFYYPSQMSVDKGFFRGNFRIPGHFWPLLSSSTDNNTDNNTHYSHANKWLGILKFSPFFSPLHGPLVSVCGSKILVTW